MLQCADDTPIKALERTMTLLIDPNSDDILVDHTRMVERVIAAMRSEVEPLRLEDLAEIAGLSPYYFNRIFKSIIGIPPGEFATSLRFERAKHLLLTTQASVTEICMEVGYGSLGTFSTRFKHMVGVTPAKFRTMPDAVADLDFGASTFNVDPRQIHIRGRIEGTMHLPEDRKSSIFVGVFPDRIAVSRPVVGRMITEPGPFELPFVPYGRWVLLAAALPQVSDPLEHLLPASRLMVASTPPFRVHPGNEVVAQHLTFRTPHLMEPPVVTALPALLMN